MAKELLEARVARLEEIALSMKEDRIESRADRKEMISGISAMNQTLQSTSNSIAALRLEKCGERLEIHDERIRDLESSMKFWKNLIGTGFQALWKIAALMVGSGALGGLLAKFVH